MLLMLLLHLHMMGDARESSVTDDAAPECWTCAFCQKSACAACVFAAHLLYDDTHGGALK
jgi:hypothetical protein